MGIVSTDSTVSKPVLILIKLVTQKVEGWNSPKMATTEAKGKRPGESVNRDVSITPFSSYIHKRLERFPELLSKG